jgi:hypothetical protein
MKIPTDNYKSGQLINNVSFSETSTINNNINNRQRHRNNSRHRILTQTLNQQAESWPKYQILANKEDDYQRAYLNLNSEKVFVDFNLRAEYCTFWGSFLPNLVLSECKLYLN